MDPGARDTPAPILDGPRPPWAYAHGYALPRLSPLRLTFSFATPGINGGASLSVEPHEQGAAAGLLAAANTVGPILGPALGPLMYEMAPNAPMLFGASVFLILSFYVMTIRIPDYPRRS